MSSVEALIVSYNTRDVLRDCLRSIERHAPRGELTLSVAVLDNGSRDGSADMVATEFPDVRLVREQRNLGFALANNLLASSSTADYLLLLNSDTIWTADIVTPLAAALADAPLAAVAGPRLLYPDGRVQASSQELPSLLGELAWMLRGSRLGRVRPIWDADTAVARITQQSLADSRAPRPTRYLWATCWLMPRGVYERIGLFDADRFPMYDEDVDFCKRIADVGLHPLYCPAVELTHLGGASSTWEERTELARAARGRFYRRHRGRVTELAYVRGLPAVARLRAWRERTASALRTRRLAPGEERR